MEVPRLVQSELQLLASTTATAMPNLSRVCELHHSSWQQWILNPLSEAQDRTYVLVDSSWVLKHGATRRPPMGPFNVQQLNVGSQFPDQGLNPSHSSQNVES